MNVGIVGLGLIGGSMAKSIKVRTAHTVWGIDLDAETMTLSRLSGAIDGALTRENIPACELLLVAIRPAARPARAERVKQHVKLESVEIAQRPARAKQLGKVSDPDVRARPPATVARARGGIVVEPEQV